MDSPETRSPKARKKAPSPRRDGREAAVQYLYGNDAQGAVDFSPERIEAFWSLRTARPFAREFAGELLAGVERHAAEIDSAVTGALENYAFHRLDAVDRSILRLGAYELLFSEHIPPSAAINEAVEIAKRFGGGNSPAFVNGVLDRLLQQRAPTG